MSTALEPAREQRFDEDAILVERFVLGDAQVFDTLYRRYYEKVYQIALGVLLRPEEAADATQEIFTLVYRHLPRFDRRAKFSTWLFRIAVNRSIQQARSIANRKRETELLFAENVPAKSDFDSHDPAVAASMGHLAPDDRAILTLFYWEELSLNEIAESMDCSPNAAKTRLFRARDRFKKFYEEAAK